MLILKGMKHWEDHTCVRFYRRKDEPHYIHFLAGSIGLDTYHFLTFFHVEQKAILACEIAKKTIV